MQSGARRVSGAPEACEREGGSNSVVESQPSKLLVAGSIPVSRSNLRSLRELRLAGQPALDERCGWEGDGRAVDQMVADRRTGARHGTPRARETADSSAAAASEAGCERRR